MSVKGRSLSRLGRILLRVGGGIFLVSRSVLVGKAVLAIPDFKRLTSISWFGSSSGPVFPLFGSLDSSRQEREPNSRSALGTKHSRPPCLFAAKG
jgi:hypothetical protein